MNKHLGNSINTSPVQSH